MQITLLFTYLFFLFFKKPAAKHVFNIIHSENDRLLRTRTIQQATCYMTFFLLCGNAKLTQNVPRYWI